MAKYPQPGVPFAKIYFAGEEVTSFPDLSLQSFTYERLASRGGNKCNFVLIDQEWDQLELKMLMAKGEFSFEYGWIDLYGPSARWSKRYRMAIQKYQIRLCAEHTELQAEGKIIGDYTRSDQSQIQGQTNMVLPEKLSDAIIEIWKKRGYDTSGVDECDMRELAFIRTNGTLPQYQKNLTVGVNPTQMIQEDSQFIATGDNKKHAGYYLFTEDDDGHGKVFFKKSWDPVRTDHGVLEIPAAFNHEIISFEPDINLPAAMIGEGMSQKAFRGMRLNTGRTVIDTYRFENTKVPEYYQVYTNVGGPNNSPQNQNFEQMFATPGTAKQWTVGMYCYRSQNVNRATLIVVGDPKYNLCDAVTVLVKKTGDKGDGGLHYTSGKYLIVGINDSIQPGSYQTTLTLKKLVSFTPIFEEFEGVS